MNYYEILGVAEGASKIEIEEAYNEKVAEIKSGVKNEKNAAAFIKILTEAYDNLIHDDDYDFQEDDEEITDIEDTDQYYDEDEDENDYEYDPEYEDGKVVDLDSFYNDDAEEDDDDFTIIDRKVKEIKKKKKAKKKRKSKKIDNIKADNNKKKQENRYYELDEEDEDDEGLQSKIKNQNHQRKDIMDERKSGTSWFIKLLLLPIKILLIPVVAVIWLLSIMLKVINFAAWIVSKVLLTAAIAILAIHSYQIYKGAAADKKILLATGAVIGISVFLPPILKVMYKVLSNTSDSLLEFIF